jgi:hypothetical protein
VRNVCDTINICSYYAMYDCSLKVEMDSLVGVGFMKCFVVRSLKMQLCLFECTLIDWLGIFCMARIIFGGNVISLNRYRDLLSISYMKRKISCIVRKGEKQIQILDGF